MVWKAKTIEWFWNALIGGTSIAGALVLYGGVSHPLDNIAVGLWQARPAAWPSSAHPRDCGAPSGRNGATWSGVSKLSAWAGTCLAR